MPYKRLLINIFILFCSPVMANNASVLPDKPQSKNKKSELDIIQQQKAGKAETKRTHKDDWWYGFHQTVSDSVYDTAHWFDSFFADEQSSDLTPTTSARIRLGWKPKSRDLSKLEAKFRLKVKLPHLSNKVDLIFTDEADDELSRLPLETSSVRPEEESDSISASVRMVHKKDKKRFFDTRIGARSGDVFVKTRYKREFELSDVSLFKVEPALYYFIKDGWGERLLMQYEYQSSPKVQYRLNYSIRGSQSFSGIRWKHGIYRLHQIDNHTASMMGLIVNGERNGSEGFFVDTYSVNYRYRFNAYKEWLFFEIEPFFEWPREFDYKFTPGIALRVEGYFSKK